MLNRSTLSTALCLALGFPIAELYFWRDSAGHEVNRLAVLGKCRGVPWAI